MSIDLTKRTETATSSLISLMKTAQSDGIELGEVSAACVLVIDHSGSMAKLYSEGHVQEIAERVLALSLTGLDDDGEIQVIFFDSDSYPAETVDRSNYAGFVDRWRAGHSYGGTNYLPAITDILADFPGPPAPGFQFPEGYSPDGRTPPKSTEKPRKGFFKRRRSAAAAAAPTVRAPTAPTSAPTGPAEIPTLVFFVTDGGPSKKTLVKQALFGASNKPVFWQFIGVNDFNPKFLAQLDDMPGRVVDNVGVTAVDETLSDEAWFEEVLREFLTSWLPAARRAGIVA